MKLTPLLVLFALVASGQNKLEFGKIEGLSQSTGYSIIKDRQGFLWVATGDGLNRFDGVEMKAYKAVPGKTSGQIRGRIIRSNLLEDDAENIWFSTEESLQSFNKRTERSTIYSLSDGRGGRGNFFANPLVIDDQHLWLANPNGIFDLDLVTKESVQYPQTLTDDNGNVIQLMYHGINDRHGNFWFATNKGLLQFDTSAHQWTRHLDKHSFYSITSYRDTLYISEGREILKVAIEDPAMSFTKVPFGHTGLPIDLIHRVYKDAQNNIWVGDEIGNVLCKRHDEQTFRWLGNINHASSIRTNYPVYSFYSDSTGILWTGAYMLGLLKADIARNEFHVFPEPQVNKITEALFVNAFYESGPDKILLATFQKGIISLNKTTRETRPVELPYHGPAMLYGNSVHVLYPDSIGNLWTGSSGYVYVKEAGHTSFEAIKIPAISNALQNAQVWCMTGYKNGWLLGTNIGLFYVSAEGGNYSIIYLEWLKQSKIINIWKSDSNDIWIALESKGAIITRNALDGSDAHSVLTDTNVRAFDYDKARKVLWICTSNGLVAHHIPSGKQKVFAEREGLANSYTYNTLQHQNELWVSTNGGLFKANVHYEDGADLPDATFVNFTVNDGLPDNQFNIRAAYKSSDGVLHFGTPNGIVWFDPSLIRSNEYLPAIVVTDATVNGEPYDSLTAPGYIRTMHLPYSRNNLFLKWRGIEYSNPGKVQYAYKLDGWDKDWIATATLNEARYNNLLPGEYKFNIRASNSSGAWNPNVLTIDIAIAPPFWRTWWFYVLVTAACISSVIIITRRVAYSRLQRKLADLERQHEIDRERQRISREMHDDIGAGLTQITLISEYAKNNATNGVNKELTEIATTTRQLVHNMSEIIWSLNPENQTLGDLLSYLREQLSRQLEYSNIRFTIHFPDDGSPAVLSNDIRRNILLVTREIVNNAIRHSGALNINITARLEHNVLRFEVSDDGSGFAADRSYSGNGLKSIRERVSALGGQLEIVSEAKKGTMFRYNIPIK